MITFKLIIRIMDYIASILLFVLGFYFIIGKRDMINGVIFLGLGNLVGRVSRLEHKKIVLNIRR